MRPEKQWKQVRTGTTREDMSNMGSLGEQMLLGAGELQKLAGIPEASLGGQLLVQSLPWTPLLFRHRKGQGRNWLPGKSSKHLPSSEIKGFPTSG